MTGLEHAEVGKSVIACTAPQRKNGCICTMQGKILMLQDYLTVIGSFANGVSCVTRHRQHRWLGAASYIVELILEPAANDSFLPPSKRHSSQASVFNQFQRV